MEQFVSGSTQIGINSILATRTLFTEINILLQNCAAVPTFHERASTNVLFVVGVSWKKGGDKSQQLLRVFNC
jgi:hypothetical protein